MKYKTSIEDNGKYLYIWKDRVIDPVMEFKISDKGITLIHTNLKQPDREFYALDEFNRLKNELRKI